MASWFLDPAAGDLHPTAAAAGAIYRTNRLPEVADDFYRQLRDARPDAGADERRLR